MAGCKLVTGSVAWDPTWTAASVTTAAGETTTLPGTLAWQASIDTTRNNPRVIKIILRFLIREFITIYPYPSVSQNRPWQFDKQGAERAALCTPSPFLVLR
jgi:hypothetical protein